MNSILPIIIVIIILFALRQKNVTDNIRRIKRKKKVKGRALMNEVINKYIGKECLVYVSGVSAAAVTGTIISVDDNWVVIKNKDGEETVNLDYVVRVKEYPRNRNGKKKSIVF